MFYHSDRVSTFNRAHDLRQNWLQRDPYKEPHAPKQNDFSGPSFIGPDGKRAKVERDSATMRKTKRNKKNNTGAKRPGFGVSMDDEAVGTYGGTLKLKELDLSPTQTPKK